MQGNRMQVEGKRKQFLAYQFRFVLSYKSKWNWKR